MNSILFKSLRDLRGPVAGWSIGVGALLILIIAIYPSIQPIYSNMFDELPESLLAFFGSTSSRETFTGYLNAEFISYSPIVMSIFPIISATGMITGEENQGTLELLLAQPISRSKLILAKMVSLAISNGVVISILFSVFWLTTIFVNIENAGTYDVLTSFILLWLFMTAISYLAMFVALSLSNRMIAGTTIALMTIASYILNSLSQISGTLELFRPAYFVTYFQGSNAIVGDISYAYTIALFGIIAGISSLNIWLFIRQDIGVRST